MTTKTLHTPLEVLLFFQSLGSIGVDSSSFVKISELLKENEFIHEHQSYDPERLSPDSLKTLYLQLLKDVIRNENSARVSPGKDGERNTKKRKLSTPPLQSIDEAAEHKRLLPQLINRLYARYRDHIIIAIQEDESKYRALSKDIYEIENGEWDSRLQEEEEISRMRSKSIQSIKGLLRDDDDNDDDVRTPAIDEQTAGSVERLPEVRTEFIQAGTNANAVANTGDFGSSLPSATTKPNPLDGNMIKSPPDRPLGPPLAGQPQPFFPSKENAQGPSLMPAQPPGPAPILPPIPVSASSPTTDVYRRYPPPQGAMGVPATASPRLNSGPMTQPERASGSPIILPPPPGMLRSSGSPVGPLDPLSDGSGPPYHPNNGLPSPMQNQMPPLPHPSTLPQPRNYAQRAYPYHETQPNYAPPYSPYGQPPIPPYHSPAQPRAPAYITPTPAYGPNMRQGIPPPYSAVAPNGQYQGFQPTQSVQHTPLPTTYQSGHLPGNFPPVTPASSVNGKRRLQGLPPIDTSVSSTKWKDSSQSVPKELQKSPTAPALSPYLPSSPEPDTVDLNDQVSYAQSKKLGPEKAITARLTETPTRGRGGRGRSAGHTPRGRGGRGAKNTPSALISSKDIRVRSQSVGSHADELSMDNPSTTRRIKPEPPTTPAAATSENTSAISTPVGDTTRTSRRRDAARGLETPKLGLKRKRANTPEGTPEISFVQPPTRPNHVLASRNFPRIVAPLLHDINSHKLASLFAKPITERDAPGYHSLIYQPQDLKSIKSAISAGSRAVAAAAESAAEEAGCPATSSKAASLWVERTPEVIPPKGIVNSSQLEKEICRVFANAVMFNPDPKRGFGAALRSSSKSRRRGGGDDDGEDNEEDIEDHEDEHDDGGSFVRDAREMFEGVERSVGAWRAAERVGEDGAGRRGVAEKREESEADELAGDQDGVEDGLRRSRRG